MDLAEAFPGRAEAGLGRAAALGEVGPGVLWADLYVSPEDIAIKGAEYLRGLL